PAATTTAEAAPTKPAPPATTETSAPVPAAESEPSAPLPVVFDRLRAAAQKHSPSLFPSLQGGELLERGEEHLRIAASNAFHARRLEDRTNELADLCRHFFGRSLRIEIEVAGEPASPPNPLRPGAGSRPADREAARQRRHEALNHPAVNVALEVLQGDIVDIRPLGGRLS
ncbi:MAG: hypothetical protein MJE66_15210, partial [Proteobacteria bacterium]|nr:hypothetical protein [Pseudomonadota bacterium]